MSLPTLVIADLEVALINSRRRVEECEQSLERARVDRMTCELALVELAATELELQQLHEIDGALGSALERIRAERPQLRRRLEQLELGVRAREATLHELKAQVWQLGNTLETRRPKVPPQEEGLHG
ncbi:hypothetical protein [Nannocystis exedens]|uniref:hypothetical protein n=1 Tax=Nannocystis exedens TaxID=54 RepID=UPI000BBA0DA4|nr:hypothetical protein [Nannocystis exedens]PCC66452.1 hypothetical protein NAEX_09040 [Nannocystis exedens]